ncbi:MBL fold metallo-hydrolase [Streptomyces chartreusis]|uniref:MBL fold metallo-hydrolase n=1 Tax=unclassified Streptomyces TaxID=2593676 RepID=UPI000AD2D863|nr:MULTISPECIES: MBL fold metallo-hydrolase [unclassified Streptomyces]
MTHLHLDHVSGFPGIPKGVPIYTGAREAEATLFLNLFAQGTNIISWPEGPRSRILSSRKTRTGHSKG